MAQALGFKDTPDSSGSSVQLLKYDIPIPEGTSLLVKMLAAPINPLDLLVLANKYPVRPQNFEQGNMIAGYDGLAEVVGLGPDTQGFECGDRVILKRHGLGTWRTHAVFGSNDLLKVPKDMQESAAAILRMGTLNAYLLLETNIQQAKSGDWVIINAATGVVAHFLTQFANLKGMNVICIIRDREDAQREKLTLQKHGAAVVLEEKELSDSLALDGKQIMLGFDAVFGAGGQTLLNMLSPGATYVVYGFQGGLHTGVHVEATQELIFLKNITFKGFRLSAALAAMKDQEQEALFVLFSEQLRKGQLTMPLLEPVDWNAKADNAEVLQDAIRRAGKGRIGQHKMVFVFS